MNQKYLPAPCTVMLVVACLLCCGLVSCLPELVGPIFEAADLKPPSLEDWQAVAETRVVLRFDEPVSASLEDFSLHPSGDTLAMPLGLLALSQDAEEAKLLCIEAEEALLPGQAYLLSGLVHDDSGNCLSFCLPLWGYNAQPPLLVINEVLSVGSSTRPDAVEFYVHAAGNLAGLSFFIGVHDDYDARYIFPACAVEAGELIVLHLKPQGLPEELDELDATDVSGGLDAKPGARDFWYPGQATLPGKNGALSLYLNPQSTMLDAIIYTDRTSQSDSSYRGFGTAKQLRRVDAIVAAGHWLIAGYHARPEDAVPANYLTSTRTLCRSSSSADSDQALDWHTVPTSGSTIGETNRDEVYQP